MTNVPLPYNQPNEEPEQRLTETNPPTSDNLPPTSPAAVPPKKKKRRWLLRIALALVIFVILLVALLPTLASLSPVRSLVLGQAQAFVPHGKLDVASWSLGWFSPIRVQGVKLYDDRGGVIIEADDVHTNFTLLQAVRQKFDFTGTVIDAAGHLVIYPNGHTNLQQALGQYDAKPVEKHEPHEEHKKAETETTLPDVKGDITLKLRGEARLVDAADATVAEVRLLPGSGGTVRITDINQPVTTDLQFLYDTGDATKPGSLSLKSSVDAVDANKLDLANLAATIDLPVRDVDLAGLKPFLTLAGQNNVRVAGILSGGLTGELKPGQAGGVSGKFTVANFEAAAPQLKDTIKAATLEVPISITRAVVAGVSRLTLDTGVLLPELSVKLTGDLPEPALAKLSAKQMPGDHGIFNVALAADLKKLATAMPNTLGLLPNLTIDQGTFATAITATLNPDNVQTHVKTDLFAKGTRDGKPVSVDPITFTADATATDLANPVAALRDLAVSFSSAFADFKAGGKSIATLQGNGTADLDKMRQQLAQVINLDKVQLAGAAKFSLASAADPKDAAALHTDLKADIARLKIGLPDQPPLDLPTAIASATADILTNADGVSIKEIRTATASVLAGDSVDSPLIDAALTAAKIDIATQRIGQLVVTKCSMPSLPRVQALLTPFTTAFHDQKIDITNGSMNVVLTAKDVDVAKKSLTLTQCEAVVLKAKVQRDGQDFLSDTVRFRTAGTVAAGDGLAVDLSLLTLQSAMAKIEKADGPLTLKRQGDQLVSAGGVTLDVDLVQTGRLAKIMSPTIPEVTAGRLNGKLALAASKDASFTFNSTLTGVSLKNDVGQVFAFDAVKPATLNVAASLQGSPAIDGLRVTDLSGDLGIVQIAMSKPIAVSGLSTKKLAAQGDVTLSGDAKQLLALAAVFQQAAAPMPYGGAYKVALAFAPDGGGISLKGDGTIDGFTVFGEGGKPTFAEKQVRFHNDLTFDPTAMSALIRTVTLDMATSKAATIELHGGVEDLLATRQLKNLVVTVNAVGEKVWPIIYAFLPPAQQTQFGDLKLTGPVRLNLLANGSYPAKPTWNESVRTVIAYGDVFVSSVKTMGLDVSEFALPISVTDGGKLVTGDTRKKGAARFAKPFIVNGGQGDFGSMLVELGDPAMRLSIGKRQKILQKVQLNPVMAAQLGSLASIVFKDAEEASGLIDLTVVDCQNVPLLDLMNKHAAASFTYSVHNLRIDGPVPSALSSVLQWGDKGIVGDINDATLSLKAGKAIQDMTLALQRQTKVKNDNNEKVSKDVTETLKFKGGIDLASQKFDGYALTLSQGLLLKDIRDSFPNGAEIELKGKVSDVGGALAKGVLQLGAKGVGGKAIDQILGGLNKKKAKEK